MSRTRRELLAVSAAALTAGCRVPRRTGGPRPTVGEHFQADVSVRDTTRRIRFDAPDVFEATVRNEGYDAAVTLRLYWVPATDASPTGKPHAELLDAGYEPSGEQVVTVPGGTRRTVAFERSMPPDAAGYYVRYHALTYGARVHNRGAGRTVRVTLVDTTDMSDQRTLASKRVEMDADERRVVTFRTRARFESFRVDAVPA